MIFVGAQSIYTRALLANEKICMHDFFCGGHLGGTENLWGARPPPPPVATPLDSNHVRFVFNIIVDPCYQKSDYLQS